MSIEKLIEKAKRYKFSEEKVKIREQGILDFVKEFPREQLDQMSLEKYAQGNKKNSFCYWLEFKGILFGIGGGNASKFGIYRGKDGNYYSGAGSTRITLAGNELNNYYSSIKDNILKALEYTENNEIDKIVLLNIPLWNMVLQKILNLYNPNKFIRIGAPKVLIKCAQEIELDDCELTKENSILISYLIHKKLKSHEFFKDWPEEKLSSFLWEEFGDSDPERSYYILGSKYGAEHKFDDMLRRSVVAVGFADHIDMTEYYLLPHIEIINYLNSEGEEKKSQTALKHFLSLKPGDLIAIKSDGSPKGNKGYLKIVGYAEVIEKGGVVYEYDPDRLAHIVHVRYLTPKISEEFDIGGYGSTIHKISNKDKIKQIFPSKFTNSTSIMPEEKQLSLNTILYGPPGTGKTYKLKNEYFAQFTDEHSTQSNMEFYQELAKELTWREAIGVVLLDLNNATVDEIFNHPLIQANCQISDNTKPKRMIRWRLRTYSKEDCTHIQCKNRRDPQLFIKDENEVWSIDVRSAKDEDPDLFDALDRYKTFVPQRKQEKRYTFTTFHQSFSYEDFIEGIKPHLSDEKEDTEDSSYQDVKYHIADGIFKKICDKAKKNPQKDYAIFIDEINRGNIANIFGELITLIEEDKRMDAPNYISTTLPYSKKEFGVPKNLYIIGTMNTADRSVEALDTALRRRFSFVEMNPQPQLLSDSNYILNDFDLEKLLTTINSRIEKLLDKDYCIGHSYFMTIKDREEPLLELRDIFSNKIIPLLQEYFYGDWGKILLVLGKGFITKKNNSVKFLGTDQYSDSDEFEEKPIYCFTSAESWSLEIFKGIYESQE